eukprot:7385409-Prymnesium_polylepis.1
MNRPLDAGFWKSAPIGHTKAEYRILNNTLDCVGPKLVVFRRTPPNKVRARRRPPRMPRHGAPRAVCACCACMPRAPRACDGAVGPPCRRVRALGAAVARDARRLDCRRRGANARRPRHDGALMHAPAVQGFRLGPDACRQGGAGRVQRRQGARGGQRRPLWELAAEAHNLVRRAGGLWQSLGRAAQGGSRAGGGAQECAGGVAVVE